MAGDEREPEVLWEGEAGEGVHHQRYRVLADGTIEGDGTGSWHRQMSRRIAAGEVVLPLAADRARLREQRDRLAMVAREAVYACVYCHDGELYPQWGAYQRYRAPDGTCEACFEARAVLAEVREEAPLARLEAGGEED